MTTKEISVLFIGLLLIGFLYLMKHPSIKGTNSFNITQNSKTIGIDIISKQDPDSFDPTTEKTILEGILDIPAWNFILSDLEERTSEELVGKISQLISQENFFVPEQQNALYYLLTLKSIDSENQNIDDFSAILNQQITKQIEAAITDSNEQLLTKSLSKLKTLDKNNPNLSVLKEKLSKIKTINKLYRKGIKQIQNNLIVTNDSQDAWHTAKQCLNIDNLNPITKQLVTQVNSLLINNALRAAEESDFQLANNQLNQAQLLSPQSLEVLNAEENINQLKQKRYIWLEQQINLAIAQANITRSEKIYLQLEDLGLTTIQLSEYQNEINRITLFGTFKPLDIFNDLTQNQEPLPTMVVMPIDSFTMGYDKGAKNEKPVHQVTINYGFAVSQNEITVADFATFISASKYKTDAEINRSSKIYDLRTGRLKNKHNINWHKNFIGKKAGNNNPVIHVSWNDANAYIQWLSEQTGKNYRLLSESEFEFILRAGSKSIYPWGNDTPVQVTENLTGEKDKYSHKYRISWKQGFKDYNDNHWGPAPVASFIPNPFKLNDTAGNVMEWVSDCWHDSYTRAPIDGSAWLNPGCEDHVIRGGSWSSAKNEFRSAHRFKARANFTDARLGFRIAVDL